MLKLSERRTMPKYGFTVTQSGAQFVARVVRRRTSRGTTVEKEATFEDRPSAEKWGRPH
jgi:hypothetical protein